MSNNFKKQLDDRKKYYFKAGVDLGTVLGEQRTIDLFQIALHRKGWGYQRVREITEDVEALANYYSPAFYVNMEQDIYQERMDGELLDLIKDQQRLVPFRERYPSIQTEGYNKAPKSRYV